MDLVPKKYLAEKNPYGPVAQGIEQQPSKLKVAGSNPAGVASKINGLLNFGQHKVPPKIQLAETGAERMESLGARIGSVE